MRELVKFRDAYFAYYKQMYRFQQNPQSVRELLGPTNLRLFNSLHLNRINEGGTSLETSNITDDDILNRIDALERNEGKLKPRNVASTLKSKLSSIWKKGDKKGHSVTTLVAKIWTSVVKELRDHDRMDLIVQPPATV